MKKVSVEYPLQLNYHIFRRRLFARAKSLRILDFKSDRSRFSLDSVALTSCNFFSNNEIVLCRSDLEVKTLYIKKTFRIKLFDSVYTISWDKKLTSSITVVELAWRFSLSCRLCIRNLLLYCRNIINIKIRKCRKFIVGSSETEENS